MMQPNNICTTREQVQDIDALKEYLKLKNLDKPWVQAYSGTIEQLTHQQMQDLFDPIQSFTQSKKVEFIINFVRRYGESYPILEVGGGTGSLSRYIARSTTNSVVCMDIDSASLECGRALAEYEGLDNIEFICANFSSVDFGHKYSVIILDSVLEHIIEYKSWLEKLYALAPNHGKVVVIVPSILGVYSLINDFDFAKLKWKGQEYNYHPGQHVNHFSFRALKGVFAEHGFSYFGMLKFQCTNAAMKRVFEKLGLHKLYNPYCKFDYALSKILPADVSTRVVTFEKSE